MLSISNNYLFEECINKFSINEISKKLNVSIGTVKRWIEYKNVPSQYTFDIYKLLSKEINYNEYTSVMKDQFFTPKDIAKKCWKIFRDEIKINIQDYTFVEPSAGDGSFLNILPDNTIAFDVEPRHNNIIKQDFLDWTPQNKLKKYIVFGNPPFGLRGHLALKFINHSSTFADYVCFILPQLFQSDGKGSPRKRVSGYNLLYSESIFPLFYTPEKQKIKVNCVFQIWSKYSSNPNYDIKNNFENKIKIYSLSNGGTVSTTRNKHMIGKCDIYLPSTCFGKENMKIYQNFEDLPNKRGYGIIFIVDKINMKNTAHNIDWSSVSFLSTNSAYNLRTSIILNQFNKK